MSARLAAPALAAALLSPAAPALADDACQPLIDAMVRFAATPSHGFMSGAGVKAGGDDPNGRRALRPDEGQVDQRPRSTRGRR